MVCYRSARFIVALALLCMLGLFTPVVYAAQSQALAVIYPNLQEPYRGVFSSIIEGIQQQAKVAVSLYPIDDGAVNLQLAEKINLTNTQAIIALGRTGLEAAEQWRGKIPIVVGGLLLAEDKNGRGLAGISLAANPVTLLAHLKQLAPSVKRVHVVYSSESSKWLVNLAQDAIGKFNFELHVYKSDDIKSSALIYRDIFNKSHPQEDAIWLLPDPVAIDSRIILPLLLKEAWNNNVLLFSSNPAQVKRGVLFALFPDNKSMGMSLAKMAESYIGDDISNMSNEFVPLNDLQAAINVRTAEHIGLPLSNEERRDYVLIFPAP